MAAGDVTPGVRREDGIEPWELGPGEYCDRGGGLWVCLPSGVGPACLSGPSQPDGWEVEWHEDGTVTVSPSIFDHTDGPGWHGYLERGVWREV